MGEADFVAEDSKMPAVSDNDGSDWGGESEGLVGNDALEMNGGNLKHDMAKKAPGLFCVCGECGEKVATGQEIYCPGCDSPMHMSCGKSIGGEDDSPFRMCLPCQSSNTYRRESAADTRETAPRKDPLVGEPTMVAMPPASRGLRRRSPSGDDLSEGIEMQVVSKLMSKQPPKEAKKKKRLQRKMSKPTAEDEMIKPLTGGSDQVVVGGIGTNHSMYLLFGISLLLVMFIVYQVLVNGLSFGRRGNKPGADAPEIQHVTVPMSDLLVDWQDSWWLDAKSDAYLKKVWPGKQDMKSLIEFRGSETNFAASSGMMDDNCGRYQFDLSKMPSVSIIIGPVYEGYPEKLLSLNVHTLLARTPARLIQEIVLVRDKDPVERESDNVDFELKMLEHLSNKIKIKSMSGKAGRFKSRQNAIDDATGEIIVMMDPYVEVWSSHWLQQLIVPILENKRTLSVPLVHEMTPELSIKDDNITDPKSYYTVMNKEFGLERVYDRFGGQKPPSTFEPYLTPWFDGPIFAANRDEFSRKLDGIDRGMQRAKGDTVEMALKYWLCRGRVVAVPCSRAGYIPIDALGGLPALPDDVWQKNGVQHSGAFFFYGKRLRGNPDRIMAVRNYMRILRVWFHSSAVKDAVYEEAFGSPDPAAIPPEWKQYEQDMEDDDCDIDSKESTRDTLACQSIEWFDKHVLMSIVGTHHPWYDSVIGKEAEETEESGGPGDGDET